MRRGAGGRFALALGLMMCLSSAQAAGEPDCNAVRTAYADALSGAQTCDVAAPDSCAAERPRTPVDACRCLVSVNPQRTAELDRLLERFKSLSCAFEPPLCNRACVLPARRCTADGGSPAHCAREDG